MLAALSPDFAIAQVVPQGDARISTERITYDSPSGSGPMKAYVAKPANATGKLPAVLVVHENRGLNPHIEDISRRLAVAGYLALAPDALTPLGGYPGDEDQARTLFAQLDQAKTRQDFLAAAALLKARPDSSGRLGVVGFCYGGGVAHFLATQLPDLAAAVPFYGNHPPAEDAAKVKAPLLIHFAGIDERINAAWPTYEAALKTAGVRHIAHKESLAQLQQQTPTVDRALDAGQTDISAFAGASLLGVNLDASITQSVYTQNLPRLIRPIQPAAVAGSNPTAFGFPDTTAEARLTIRTIPVVKRFGAFNWRALKSDQPAARTYTAGASAGIGFLEVSAFYSLYDPGRGAPKHGYAGAGAGVKF